MTLQNNLITFHKPTSPDIGGVDDSNLVKLTGESLQTISGEVQANKFFVLNGGSIGLGNAERYFGVPNNRYDIDYVVKWNGGKHIFWTGAGTPLQRVVIDNDTTLINNDAFVAENKKYQIGNVANYIYKATGDPNKRYMVDASGSHVFYCGGGLVSKLAITPATILCAIPLATNVIQNATANSDVVLNTISNVERLRLGLNGHCQFSSSLSVYGANEVGNILTVNGKTVKITSGTDALVVKGGALIAEDKVNSNVYNSNGANEPVFQVDGSSVFKFNTSGWMNFMQGLGQCVMYEDQFFDLVTYNVFRFRNLENSPQAFFSFGLGSTLDVFQIAQDSVSSSVKITTPEVESNTYDSFGDNNVIFRRNGVQYYFTLGNGYSNANGAPSELLSVNNAMGLSSPWVFGNSFANRTDSTDTAFRGAVVGGSAWGKEYMAYEHVAGKLHVKDTDMELDAGKSIWFNNAVNARIGCYTTGGFQRFQMRNDDPTGDIAFFINASTKVEMKAGGATLGSGYSLTGELVDTSSLKVKYDIKPIAHNFTDMVQAIEPKTFKMIEEKKIDINRNHIGFIAEEVQENIPEEFENIIYDIDDVKRLNYVKLNAITWGAVREIIQENEHMKKQIQNLESSVYELQEAVKALTKPKAKAKPKTKVERT